MIFIREFCELIADPDTEIEVRARISGKSFKTTAEVLKRSLCRITKLDFKNGIALYVDDAEYEQLELLA